MKNIVNLKALQAESWSGFHRFPKCKDSVVVCQGRSGYDTGLTEEDEKKFEKLLNLDEGTLNRYSAYWKDYVIWIDSVGLQLDLSVPQDALDYAVLQRNKRVAVGHDDRKNKPLAEYVLVDTAIEAKKENLKVKMHKEAMKKFGAMTIHDMKKVLKLLGKRADNTLDEAVENALFDLIEKDAQMVLDIINIPDFDMRNNIEDMLHLNVLRRQGSKYIYADDVIGYNLEETIDFLKDPKNQEILRVLKDKLAAKAE